MAIKRETAIGRKLGQKVRELRKNKGLTQERLAELSDISYKHIQRIEGKPNHASFITLASLSRLAAALDTSLSNLVHFD